MRTLTHEQAREAYDRIGTLQDSQAFYEDIAVGELLTRADLGSAEAVFELGCGTGRVASLLLRLHLSSHARYVGVDVSPTMTQLAQARLAMWKSRAEVRLSSGSLHFDEPDDSFDRFISTFVLDLFSEADIQAAIDEAARLLRSGGLLCLTSATTGDTPTEQAVVHAVKFIHRLRPELVGGCRPVQLLPFLRASDWELQHHGRVSAWGLPSEVLIARRSG